MTGAGSSRPSLGSLAFSALLWVVVGYVVIEAFSFRYPANVAPLLLGGSAFGLLTLVLIRDLLRLRRGSPESPAEPAADPEAEPPDSDDPEALAASYQPPAAADPALHERAALAWTFAAFVLLMLLGFLIGVSVGMVGLLRIYARESWRATLITTVAVMVTLYVAFGVFLGVQFFPGFLPDALGLAP